MPAKSTTALGRPRGIGRFFRKYGKHYIGLTPFLLLFAVFILAPMLYGIIMSLTSWSTKAKATVEFVGLENFRNVLTSANQVGRRFLTLTRPLLEAAKDPV